jgi:hypothetical protein
VPDPKEQLHKQPSGTNLAEAQSSAGQRGEIENQPTSSAIRSELTLEKWPAIWRPASSHGEPEVRTLARKLTLPDGREKNARVEVGYTDLGNLTTEDQKTYYALIKQWEESGRRSEQTFFSIRQLARLLKKNWGTNVIGATTQSLRRLRTTAFTWTNSYHDAGSGEELEILDTFTIVSDLKIVRRKIDGHITREMGYFRFHDLILKNLLANHTKPLLFDVVLGFKSEVAQLLYIHVDLILATNDHYERRTKELFDDLGLRGAAYRNRSDRRRRLAKALAELNGVPLSTGTVTKAAIEKTKDGKDFKIVIRKSSAIRLARPNAPERGVLAGVKNDQGPLAIQAKELVSRFHALFHHTQNSFPSSKEVAQAVSLITTHGFERARRIVDFSHVAAAETAYKPQTFGGILQYASRALAEFEIRQRDQHLTPGSSFTPQSSPGRATDDENRTDAILARLPESEFRECYAIVRADFLTKYPNVAAWKPQLVDRHIRSLMAKRLEESVDEATEVAMS